MLLEICWRAFNLKVLRWWGAWVAQMVKGPSLDFHAGHDLTVPEFEPRVGLCMDSTEPAWDPLAPSLSLSALLPLTPLSLSLKNKH